MAAVICRGDDVLLVQERPEQGAAAIWMLPGGRVEPGEDEIGALCREVREETGLVVKGSPQMAFQVDITAELDDWVGRWRTVTFACSALGELAPDDPDQFVLRPSGSRERLPSSDSEEWSGMTPSRSAATSIGSPGRGRSIRIG